MTTNVTKKPETNQIIIERTFAASPERVFNAFTSPDELAKWWGPEGWETTTKEFEFRPGGRWHYGMKCVDEAQGEWFGTTSWGVSIYETINTPVSYSYTDYFSNEAGELDENMPLTKSSNSFEAEGDGCRFTSVTTCNTREEYDKLIGMGMIEGFDSSLNRLESVITDGK